jgi:hypothetical protein
LKLQKGIDKIQSCISTIIILIISPATALFVVDNPFSLVNCYVIYVIQAASFIPFIHRRRHRSFTDLQLLVQLTPIARRASLVNNFEALDGDALVLHFS